MLTFIKALHIIGLTAWSAGLVMIPVLLARHGPRARRRGFERLRRLTRFSFTVVVSPAAVTSIGTGMILIFMTNVAVDWMAPKLALVAGMAVLHAELGGHIMRLSNPDDEMRPRKSGYRIGVAGVLITGVLMLALAKPTVPNDVFPNWLLTPGAHQLLSSARSTPT